MDIFHHICLMENPEISSMIYPYLSLFIHWNVRIFHCHEQELKILSNPNSLELVRLDVGDRRVDTGYTLW